MPPLPDDDHHQWQRSTDHPSARALLAFLEADLQRGLLLVRQAETELATAGPAAARPALGALHVVLLEITRWLDQARKRKIPLGSVEPLVAEFSQALRSISW